MNYNELFDVIYSTKLLESVKEAVLSNIQQSIVEDNNCSPIVETYLDLIDTLTFSTVSEDKIQSILDEVFENVDEAIINEVSDEYIKRKAQAGLKQREKAYKEVSSNPVGLSQIDRVGSKLEKAQNYQVPTRNYSKPKIETTPNTPSNTNKEGVMGKLKSAVGKVKNWYDKRNSTTYDEVRHAIGRKAIENEKKGEANFKNPTTINPEPKAEAPKVEAPKVSKPKVAKVSKPKVKVEEPKKTEVEAPKVEAKAEVKTEAPKVAKAKSPKKTEIKAKTTKEVKAEAPKAEAPKINKEAKTKVADAIKTKTETSKAKESKKTEVKTPKAEMTDEERETKKAEQRMKRDLAQARKSREQALNNAKDRLASMTSKPGYSEEEAGKLREKISELEAALKEDCIAELTYLLGNSNISEGSFVEIMELFAPNKCNASKAKARHEEEVKSALDELNKEVINNDINPETVEKVNNAAQKNDRFQEIYRKHFGDA